MEKVIISDLSVWCGISFTDQTSNPLYYAKHLYLNATEIKDLVVPNDVTSIRDYAFQNCEGLTSLTLPENLETIGYSAFAGCSNLTSINIPDGVKEIGASYNPSFPEEAKLYVNRGTTALLALWEGGLTPYQKNTETLLPAPTMSLISANQASALIQLENYYSEYSYYVSTYFNAEFSGTEVTVTGLRPNYNNTVHLYVTPAGTEPNLATTYDSYIGVQTLPLTPSINIVQKTASSITIKGMYLDGDAVITQTQLTLNGKTVEEGEIHETGLTPNSSYSAVYSVTVAYGSGNWTEEFEAKTTINTDALTLTTQQPKVISVGNVIVSAASNLDDAEENVGFEWRRTDWTDDFASSTGQAYMYEGTIEGYIRNLNTEKLWKYRPYYLSASGTYYYGDWVGIDPTNTSYFEPTVHTYAEITIDGNTALVKGYALRGTDNITVQGFKYWKNTNSAHSGSNVPLQAPAIPANAQTVEAEGYVMEASLTGLDHSSEYCYVAFVKTSEGETFYGEQRTFTTGEDTTGIDGVRNDNDNEVHEVARYNMQGVRITSPERGLNIVRMSDGTVRKVMVK
ncbi:MAG: leucine-rich repeat domain-containing protein [Prevotella sp.]|nr:leucine-rich repeat domain-containing protein [Prevotella sp.]